MNRLLLTTAVNVTLLGVACWLLHFALSADVAWTLFAAALVALLLHHMRHVDRLTQWLKDPTRKVPTGSGAWDYIFSLLYRHERVQTRQQRELAKTLVRFRQAGRAHPDGVIIDRKSTRLNSSHVSESRMPSSA